MVTVFSETRWSYIALFVAPCQLSVACVRGGEAGDGVARSSQALVYACMGGVWERGSVKLFKVGEGGVGRGAIFNTKKVNLHVHEYVWSVLFTLKTLTCFFV